ncbi:hypothetical protein [Streptomyces avicenniae]|uniref:TPR repeat region-containing protein n=1 Tax=Streptomyces avicenniae TaxID=500153 RepID=UPI00069AE11B|nr:hypothetical protein [Streptomyces avicenniae]
MAETDFTREDVETAADARPWSRRHAFLDEIDPDGMAETAAQYARAAAEADDAGDLARAATRAAETSGHLDGGSLIDDRERIDSTARGLHGNGAELDAVTGLLVRAMNRALEAVEEIDVLVEGPCGLDVCHRTQLEAARAELAAPPLLLTGGTYEGGDLLTPGAVAGGELSRAAMIRLRHLGVVADRASLTDREMGDALAAYRRKLAEYGTELDGLGYDITGGPLDLWTTTGMAAFAADRLTDALRGDVPDVEELQRWTTTLAAIGSRLYDPLTGRPLPGVTLTAGEIAYLQRFYAALDARELAALGALSGGGPHVLSPAARDSLADALGRVADGVVTLTDPAVGGSIDRLPLAVAAYLGVNDDADLPPRDTGELGREQFEDFADLMSTATATPGGELARELDVQRTVVALWAREDAGDDTRPGREAALRTAFAAMDPVARAEFWRAHRDDLLDAGLLSAPPDNHHDPGAGPYDSQDARRGDYALWAELRGGSALLDIAGMPDASRFMDHYLSGRGTPLEADVDRMLRDSAGLRFSVDAAIAEGRPKWVEKAGEAFEKSGGQPVSIPVHGRARGFRSFEDDNWNLAVGGLDRGVSGVVTVEPGADGRPQARLEYQVNIWDRYNWDSGKSIEIGPTTMNDSDVGRLHTTGLAKEFDVTGRSSPVSVPLSLVPDSSLVPGPVPDPGRDGTRADPGRNGDAR